MKFGEQFDAIQRKTKRKFTVPQGVDPALYHGAQKIAGDKYEPRLIGHGAEHLVFKFEDPKHPDTVYKVNFRETALLLDAQQHGPETLERANQRLQAEMEQRKERLGQLRQYLGFQAVPVQKYMVRELPVNIDVIAKLAPHLPVDPANLPEKVNAWVTVQRKLEAPSDKIMSLHGYYPELLLDPNHEGHRRLYQGVNEIALNQPLSGDTPDNEELQKDWVCHMYSSIASIRARAERDSEFLKNLKKSIQNLIRYTERTGQTLDIAGKNNLIMLQGKNNEWQLKLMDPLLNEEIQISDLQYAIKRLKDDRPLKNPLAIKALNALNYVRIINCLALIAKVPERIHIPEPQEQSPALDNPFADFDEDIPIVIDSEDEGANKNSSADMNIPIPAFFNFLNRFRKN